MSQTWTLKLPIDKPMSLNAREHHMARYRKTKEIRDAVHWLAKGARIPSCQKIRVTLIYHPRVARRRDSLNLVATQKACEDGLVDAKVVPDDTPFFVESCMPLIDAPDRTQPSSLELYVERVL